MAEFIANAIQNVAVNQNIVFTDTIVKCNKYISHRDGSGLITLRGNRGCDCQGKARYLVTFSGNIGVPTGGTVPSEISVTISMDGETYQPTRMRAVVMGAENYYNVSAPLYIDVPNNCCTKISVTNTSAQAINVQNANMTVVRVA